MKKLYTVSTIKTGSDCDHELLIAKFRLKLKKGKTTRPFRYDLNQIPYDYTVEVRNRFKGLDLIESLMNYGRRFVTLYRRQGSRPSSWERNAKRQNGCLRTSTLFQYKTKMKLQTVKEKRGMKKCRHPVAIFHNNNVKTCADVQYSEDLWG